MMRQHVLASALATLLAACAGDRVIPPPVSTATEARRAVPFCAVAERAWGGPVAGDPPRTRQQKASYGVTGEYLCGWAPWGGGED